MEIFYIANSRIPTEKAHGIQIMNMCNAFAEVGNTVTLIVPKRKNPIKDDPYLYYGIPKTFSIKYLPTLDLVELGMIGFLIQSITFGISAFFTTRHSDAEIIYSRDEVSLWFLSFFKKNIYWEVHSNRYNFVIRRVLNRCAGVIAITAGIKRLLIERHHDERKIFVSPDGVNLNIFKNITVSKQTLRQKLTLPTLAQIVGYVGKYRAMDKTKGVDMLIRSFPQILKEVPNAHLLLVGINKDEVDEVESLFKNTGIPKNSYSIVTHICHSKAMEYLKASDVLVMNYPNQEYYAYCLSPLKLFEYMMSGNPIVTSDLPSIREILSNKSAYFVKPDDKKELALGVVNLLKNPGKGAKLAQVARDSVQEYSWQKRASSIINFIMRNK
ncbi:MAG: glycosyltransferase family 4 protein [Candidatus Pacebacteria bacterium]|nr:glycosyltransferase family 4 protein [Candidatus Paceibacterota bacterium]